MPEGWIATSISGLREPTKTGRERSSWKKHRVDTRGGMTCCVSRRIGWYVPRSAGHNWTQLHSPDNRNNRRNVKLSPISAHFNWSNQSSYIGTAYLLSSCCSTPLYGRFSDILGRRGALLLGLSFFVLGTLLCGTAPSMSVLLAARVIVGMGGGGLVSRFHVSFLPSLSVHSFMTGEQRL